MAGSQGEGLEGPSRPRKQITHTVWRRLCGLMGFSTPASRAGPLTICRDRALVMRLLCRVENR